MVPLLLFQVRLGAGAAVMPLCYQTRPEDMPWETTGVESLTLRCLHLLLLLSERDVELLLG